jgi:hypothetical protein
VSAERLARAGLLDSAFPTMLRRHGRPCFAVDADQAHVAAALGSDEPLMTRIIIDSPVAHRSQKHMPTHA